MKKIGKHKKLGTIVTMAGIFLILAAASITVFNLWDETRAGKSAETVLDEILDRMEQQTTDAPVSEVSWSEEAKMPSLAIDKENYIGILEIPVLKLTLPVRDVWSYPNLRKTPCRYTGSVYSHDMIIAGHNYDTHFGRLKTLKKGDEVYFTDIDRNRFAYKVTDISVLSPFSVEEMTAVGEWDLTLFTCTIGGRSRVTVRCTGQEL